MVLQMYDQIKNEMVPGSIYSIAVIISVLIYKDSSFLNNPLCLPFNGNELKKQIFAAKAFSKPDE